MEEHSIKLKHLLENTTLADSKAEILLEALPFMQRYDGQCIVIKFGGNAMVDDESLISFAKDVVLLRQSGMKPVIVHGGGPQIGKMLKQLGVKSQFSRGLRVTDEATMEVAEMVLCGPINNSIVSAIQKSGGNATGCSGKDGGMIKAKKITSTHSTETNVAIDLGLVGEPAEISTSLITCLIDSGFIPVIAPIGYDDQGNSLNVNADTAAGAIASALKAKRLLMLSDISGILDKDGNHIQCLNETNANNMMNNDEINGGMIPKTQTGFDALREGVDAVVILDGRKKHSIIVELFTDKGCGTMLQL